MNGAMYEHPATQANLAPPARARRDRARAGHRLARVARRVRHRPPARAARAARRLRGGARAPAATLDGLKVLVTAGGTREPIDAVRFVGNRSSGRMGFALAEEAARRGADVTVVAANVSLPRRAGIEYVDVADRRRARRGLRRALRRRRRAADGGRRRRLPAGRRARRQAQEGRDRRGTRAAPRAYRGRARPTLAARRRPGQLLVGFAAEHGEGAVAYGAREARPQGPRRRRRQRRRRARHRLRRRARTRSRSSPPDAERHVPRASKAEVAACHPGRGLEPPFIFRHEGAALNGTHRALEPPRGRRASAPQQVAAAVSVARRIAREHPPRGEGPRRHPRATSSSSLLAEGHILVEDYPGVGKTALARALSRSIDCAVRARAVHGRPAARRHRRHQRLQPARGALRVPARADLRQHRDRRRDQPRLAEDAVRPARVHAGAPGHRRRDLARAGAPVPRLRDAEPGRVRGHLPAARGAGRPLHGPRSRSATRTPTRRPGMLAGHEAGDRVLELEAGRRPRRGRSRPSTPPTACTRRARCATTSSP